MSLGEFEGDNKVHAVVVLRVLNVQPRHLGGPILHCSDSRLRWPDWLTRRLYGPETTVTVSASCSESHGRTGHSR